MRKTIIISTIVLIAIIISATAVALHEHQRKHPLQSPTTSKATPLRSTSITTSPPSTSSTTSIELKPLALHLVINVSCNMWYINESLVYNKVIQEQLYSLSLAEARIVLKPVLNYIKEHGGNITSMNFSINGNKVIITFSLKGFLWRTDGECYADTSWILEPLGLDLINNHFKETNSSLSWSGKAGNITLSIVFLLPPQKKVYKSWQEEVGHCHAHIWWPIK